jgi:hypothetical protein
MPNTLCAWSHRRERSRIDERKGDLASTDDIDVYRYRFLIQHVASHRRRLLKTAVGLGDRQCPVGEYVESNVALREKETCETPTVVSDERGMLGIDYGTVAIGAGAAPNDHR